MGWVQVTPGVTLSNVTPPNNLLLNLCMNLAFHSLYHIT